MEYPSGHHTHTHHHSRRDDDDDNREEYPPPRSGFNQPPPPRPGFDDYPPPRSGFDHYPPPPRSDFDQPEYPPRRPAYDQPPPPYHGGENQYGAYPPSRPTTQVYHSSHVPPPSSHTPDNYGYDYPPPPQHYEEPPPPPQHYEEPPPPEQSSETHHGYRPHLPSFMHHHTHESSGSDFSNKPTYKVYCKAGPNFHLTIRDDKVVLAPSDPNDPYQNWYKDEKYSTRVKDKEGCPCFALVNKTTAQAVKHSIAASNPVELVPYNADVLDQSILWTESKDLGDGYRAVRMVNNIKLNMDAFQGESGGFGNGTTVGVWDWNKGDNQRWRITPHCTFPNSRYVKKGISTKFKK